MANRNISLLNTQVVLSSGFISDPDRKQAVIKNSERVRNDLVNIAEYINGFVYYTLKTLTNGDAYPFDAAESGLSGLTMIANTQAVSNYSDVFWLDNGNGTGRPKTVKEAIEAIEAKLEQQSVNLSILERVNIESVVSLANNTNLKIEKIKRDLFGTNYQYGQQDLSFPVSEYVHQIYNTLFGNANITELNTNAINFPALTFDGTVPRTNIPGCGTYASLDSELEALKQMINGDSCDPSFKVVLDQTVFNSEPTNIKDYITELRNKLVNQDSEILTNATDIADLQNSIRNLQGGSPASDTTLGLVEEATEQEILELQTTGGTGGRLYLNPRRMFNSITQNSLATFTNSSMGTAFIKGVEYSLDSLSIEKLNNVSLSANALNKTLTWNGAKFVPKYKGEISEWIAAVASSNSSVLANVGRYYSISPNPNGTNVKVIISHLTQDIGKTTTIKNNTNSGSITITCDGFTFDRNASITLNQPYECVTFVYSSLNLNNFDIISRYN